MSIDPGAAPLGEPGAHQPAPSGASRTLGERVIALLAAAIFAVIALALAPPLAVLFPDANLTESVPSALAGPLAAAQLYLLLCFSAALPALLWWRWLRQRGGVQDALGLSTSRPRGLLAKGEQRPLRSFTRGLAGGTAMIAALCSLLAILGWYQLGRADAEPALAIWVLGGLLLAALYEELLFRGFGFWAMQRALGATAATLFTALLFAIAHNDNSGANWLGFTNTALAGVLLAQLRIRHGNLWGAWGVHLGWNACLGLLFGATTSGFAFAGRLFTAEPTPAGDRHLVLAGGSYGPEASILLTPMIVLWIAVLLRREK